MCLECLHNQLTLSSNINKKNNIPIAQFGENIDEDRIFRGGYLPEITISGNRVYNPNNHLDLNSPSSGYNLTVTDNFKKESSKKKPNFLQQLAYDYLPSTALGSAYDYYRHKDSGTTLSKLITLTRIFPHLLKERKKEKDLLANGSNNPYGKSTEYLDKLYAEYLNRNALEDYIGELPNDLLDVKNIKKLPKELEEEVYEKTIRHYYSNPERFKKRDDGFHKIRFEQTPYLGDFNSFYNPDTNEVRYYDKYDLDNIPGADAIIGNPYHLYNRINYYKGIPDVGNDFKEPVIKILNEEIRPMNKKGINKNTSNKQFGGAALFGNNSPLAGIDNLINSWKGYWNNYDGNQFGSTNDKLTGYAANSELLGQRIRDNNTARRNNYEGAWGEDSHNFYYSQSLGLDNSVADKYSKAYYLNKDYQKQIKNIIFDPIGTKHKNANNEYKSNLNDILGNDADGFDQWVKGRNNYKDLAENQWKAGQSAFKDAPKIRAEGVKQLTEGAAGLYSGLNYLNSYQPPETYSMSTMSKGTPYAQMGMKIEIPKAQFEELHNSGLLGGFNEQQFYSLAPEQQKAIVAMSLPILNSNNINTFKNGGDTSQYKKYFGLRMSPLMKEHGAISIPSSGFAQWQNVEHAYNALNDMFFNGRSSIYHPDMNINDLLIKYSNGDYNSSKFGNKYSNKKLKDLKSQEEKDQLLLDIFRTENDYADHVELTNYFNRKAKEKELEEQGLSRKKILENSLLINPQYQTFPQDNTRVNRLYQMGGNTPQLGYTDNSPTEFNPSNIIDSEGKGIVPITMQGVSQDLIAIGKGGPYHGRIKLLKATDIQGENASGNTKVPASQYGSMTGDDTIFRSDKVIELPLSKPIMTVEKVLENINKQNQNLQEQLPKNQQNMNQFRYGGNQNLGVSDFYNNDFIRRIYNKTYRNGGGIPKAQVNYGVAGVNKVVENTGFPNTSEVNVVNGNPVDLLEKMKKEQAKTGFAKGIDLDNLTNEQYKTLIPEFIDHFNTNYSKKLPADSRIVEQHINPTIVWENKHERRALSPYYRYEEDENGNLIIVDNHGMRYDPNLTDVQLEAKKTEYIDQGLRPPRQKVDPKTREKLLQSQGVGMTNGSHTKTEVRTSDMMSKRYGGIPQAQLNRAIDDNIRTHFNQIPEGDPTLSAPYRSSRMFKDHFYRVPYNAPDYSDPFNLPSIQEATGFRYMDNSRGYDPYADPYSLTRSLNGNGQSSIFSGMPYNNVPAYEEIDNENAQNPSGTIDPNFTFSDGTTVLDWNNRNKALLEQRDREIEETNRRIDSEQTPNSFTSKGDPYEYMRDGNSWKTRLKGSGNKWTKLDGDKWKDARNILNSRYGSTKKSSNPRMTSDDIYRDLEELNSIHGNTYLESNIPTNRTSNNTSRKNNSNPIISPESLGNSLNSPFVASSINYLDGISRIPDNFRSFKKRNKEWKEDRLKQRSKSKEKQYGGTINSNKNSWHSSKGYLGSFTI